jgi:hypothetical protein
MGRRDHSIVVPMRRSAFRVVLMLWVGAMACADAADEDDVSALPSEAGMREDAAASAAHAGPVPEADATLGTGSDSGARDTGGSADSSLGAAPDASPLDASSLDATSLDASAPLDSGRDAGTPQDSALPDAAPPTDAASADAGSPGVRYVGRADVRAANEARFSWSGTGVVARFVGSSVSVKLTGGRDYTVVIDGMLRPKLVVSSGTTKIADNLSAGSHTVELYRRVQGGGEGGVGASLF